MQKIVSDPRDYLSTQTPIKGTLRYFLEVDTDWHDLLITVPQILLIRHLQPVLTNKRIWGLRTVIGVDPANTNLNNVNCYLTGSDYEWNNCIIRPGSNNSRFRITQSQRVTCRNIEVFGTDDEALDCSPLDINEPVVTKLEFHDCTFSGFHAALCGIYNLPYFVEIKFFRCVFKATIRNPYLICCKFHLEHCVIDLGETGTELNASKGNFINNTFLNMPRYDARPIRLEANALDNGLYLEGNTWPHSFNDQNDLVHYSTGGGPLAAAKFRNSPVSFDW